MSTKNTAKPRRSLDELLATAALPERSVDVYLRADLRAEWDRLEAELKQRATGRLNDPERRRIATRMREIEGEIDESRVTFRLRGLSVKKVRTDLAGIPTGDDYAFNVALVRACIVDPALTDEQWTRLVGTEDTDAVLPAGDIRRLTDAATELTFGKQTVPFSHAASAATTAS